ncbi:MAG: substrate-binding domain-containing protein [Promethearchaeota archaeon]
MKLGILTLIILIIIGSSIAIIFTSEQSKERVILATTTSTNDSGLLDYLLPVYEKKWNIRIEVLSLGTGKAIATAQRGDADLLLVHAREKEDLFIEQGYGVHRACIMYNDFIIIGPSADPAGINGSSIKTTMQKLKSEGEAGKIVFYSRGDNSGTHIKELELWALIGFTPNPLRDSWYKETGTGMGNTLTITDQNNGYTLIDRGTWLFSKDNVELTLLVEGDKILLNPYGVMAVNPEKHPGVDIKFEWAMSIIAWLTSEEGQTLIGGYTVNGEVLFHPCFGICDQTHDCPTTAEEVAFWSKYNRGYTGPESS